MISRARWIPAVLIALLLSGRSPATVAHPALHHPARLAQPGHPQPGPHRTSQTSTEAVQCAGVTGITGAAVGRTRTGSGPSLATSRPALLARAPPA